MPNSRGFFAFLLATGICFGGCARYGIPLYDSPDHERFTERLPIPAKKVRAQLEWHLRQNRLLDRVHPESKRKQHWYEGVWVIDESLRYYYLHWDQRERHRVHWKIVWKVREVNAKESELSAEIFELLFWGPQEEATKRPDSQSGNWVQTPPDGYRLAREFGKFLRLIVPNDKGRLRSYQRFEVPDLKFQPKADRLRNRDGDATIFSGPYFF